MSFSHVRIPALESARSLLGKVSRPSRIGQIAISPGKIVLSSRGFAYRSQNWPSAAQQCSRTRIAALSPHFADRLPSSCSFLPQPWACRSGRRMRTRFSTWS